jgi:hypothetical protein
VRTIIAAVVLVAAVAGGCGGTTDGTGVAPEPAATTATTTAATSAPKPTAAPTTEVSERLAHWQDVVKTMGCPELADLEQKRLAIQFADQAESLQAIHDRQAKLHC